MRACMLICAVVPQPAGPLQQIFIENVAASLVATLELNPWNFERRRQVIVHGTNRL